MLRSFFSAATFATLITLATRGDAEPPAPFADTARAAIEIADPSGVSIRAALVGAAPVAARVTGDDALRIYPRAFDDADLERRVEDTTTEDVVRYPTKPAREAIDYEVALDGVAGVRLVDATVEFLDQEGVPRIRMSPPFITDARGVVHQATVDVDGCRVSTEAGLPWKVAVLPVGSPSCNVHVRWSVADYPAVLDPAWTLTLKTMNDARSHFSLVANGDTVYAIGGRSQTKGGKKAPIETIEAFHLRSQSWSKLSAKMTNMTEPRQDFGATTFSSNKYILIAGGCCNATCTGCNNDVYQFDIENNMISTLPKALPPHEFAAAIQVTDIVNGAPVERVVVLGGSTLNPDVYTPDAPDPEKWTPDDMPVWRGRFNFTATAFKDVDASPKNPARVSLLLCGGQDADGTPHAGCFVRRDGSWGKGPAFMMMNPRRGHTAAETLSPGPPATIGVVIAGGDAAGTAEVWTPLTGISTPLESLLVPHHYGAAAVRQNGEVVISGGITKGKFTITGVAEGMAATLKGSWFSRDNMHVPRRNHAMIRVGDDSNAPLLVAGGFKDGILDSSELLTPLSDNMPCTQNGDCESKHCRNFTCCGCGTCSVCTPNGCMDNKGGKDDACPQSNYVHACSELYLCGDHGNCATHDCGRGACTNGTCHLGVCTSNDDCAPGAECRIDPDKGERRCLCSSNEACLRDEVCMLDGRCDKKFGPVTPEQISCALSEPATGTFASLLAAAFALAVRRRRQKGTVAKISGTSSKNGP